MINARARVSFRVRVMVTVNARARVSIRVRAGVKRRACVKVRVMDSFRLGPPLSLELVLVLGFG